MQLSEGLTGIGVFTLRLFAYISAKLVLALGKRTHSLYTCTSPSFLDFLTRWWLLSSKVSAEKEMEREGALLGGVGWGGERTPADKKSCILLWVTLEATEYHFYHALFIRSESLWLAHIQWGWGGGGWPDQILLFSGGMSKNLQAYFKNHFTYTIPSWPCHSLYIYFCDSD